MNLEFLFPLFMQLHQIGFRAIDALDPSSESLHVAEQKGVYRKLFNVPMTSEPLDIPQGHAGCNSVTNCLFKLY